MSKTYWHKPHEEIFGESILDYQKAWIQDTSKYKIGVKSRRCGLTWTEALDDVLLASRQENPSNVYYLSTKEELGKEYITACKEWIDTLQLNNGLQIVANPREDMQVSQIKFPNGCKIQALTSNPKNLRGLAGRIVIDEAAFHENLAEVLKAAVACTMWKGDIRLISTLNGMETFLEEVELVSSNKKPGSVHKITIDDALSQGLYLKIHQKKGLPTDLSPEELIEYQRNWLEELVAIYGNAAKEELYCIPSSGQDSYFPLSLLNSVFVDDKANIVTYFLPEEFHKLDKQTQSQDTKEWCESVLLPILDSYLTMNYTSFIGMDFARIRHLSVISVLFKPYEGLTFCPLHIEMQKVPYHCQVQIIHYLKKNLKDCLGIAVDASGNGLAIAEELGYMDTSKAKSRNLSNFKVLPIKFTQPVLKDMFNTYQTGLESGKLILPYDVDILQDHIRLQEKNSIPQAVEWDSIREKRRGKVIRHCDSVYSFALAYHCYRQFDSDYEVKPKKLSRSKVNSYGYWGKR